MITHKSERQCKAEGCHNTLNPLQWKLSKNKFCARCNAKLKLEAERRKSGPKM